MSKYVHNATYYASPVMRFAVALKCDNLRSAFWKKKKEPNTHDHQIPYTAMASCKSAAVKMFKYILQFTSALNNPYFFIGKTMFIKKSTKTKRVFELNKNIRIHLCN